MPHRFARLPSLFTVLALSAFARAGGPAPTTRPAALAGVEHVVVIGIDGLSTDGVRQAAGENLKRFMAEGAYTLHARATLPTFSAPNWASILSGAGPSRHGVSSNQWRPDRHEVPPVVKGPGGIFPTIFAVLRQQDPAAGAAVFHEWEDFGLLVEHDLIDVVEHMPDVPTTAARAAEYLKAHRPRLLFVHLDLVDHAGHQFGWGSPPYLEAVRAADGHVGTVLTAIRDAKIDRSTAVFLVSDHGGRGKNHGGASLVEIEVPWMVMGPGVAKGKEITSPVDSCDTAATIAAVLGLAAPKEWTARAVTEALAAPAKREPG